MKSAFSSKWHLKTFTIQCHVFFFLLVGRRKRKATTLGRDRNPRFNEDFTLVEYRMCERCTSKQVTREDISQIPC